MASIRRRFLGFYIFCTRIEVAHRIATHSLPQISFCIYIADYLRFDYLERSSILSDRTKRGSYICPTASSCRTILPHQSLYKSFYYGEAAFAATMTSSTTIASYSLNLVSAPTLNGLLCSSEVASYHFSHAFLPMLMFIIFAHPTNLNLEDL